MKKDEALKIMDLLERADGGCQVCVRSLFKGFVDLYPRHRKLFSARYIELYDEELFTTDDEEE